MESSTSAPSASANVHSEFLPNYFSNVYLAAENRVRYKFTQWIRLFVSHGGVILSEEDQHLATHVLHSHDEEVFEDRNKYFDAKRARHVNIEWIKDTIVKGALQDDKPYRVTLLPSKKIDSQMK